MKTMFPRLNFHDSFHNAFLILSLLDSKIFKFAEPVFENKPLPPHCPYKNGHYHSCTEQILAIFGAVDGPLVSCMVHFSVHTLQWRHNGHDGVSNHQPYDCLLICLFRRRSKKTSRLRVTSLCVGNSPVTGEFSEQRASSAENVSIW